jgi:hypothetical protein
MLTSSFCNFTQAAFEPVAGRNGATFFSTAQHREAFYGLGVQDVAEFDSD